MTGPSMGLASPSICGETTVCKLRYPCSFHRFKTRESHRAYDLVDDLRASDLDGQVSCLLSVRNAYNFKGKFVGRMAGSMRTREVNRRGCTSDKRALVGEMSALITLPSRFK